MAYIRRFSTRTDQMLLQNTLQGHGGDVVACKWNPFINKWITAAEDGIIRIWVRLTVFKISFFVCEKIIQHVIEFCFLNKIILILKVNGSFDPGD